MAVAISLVNQNFDHMRPKERAHQIVADFYEILDKHLDITRGFNGKDFIYKHIPGILPLYFLAKELALLHIDKLLGYQQIVFEEFGPDKSGYTPQYLNQVKQEIEKL